MASRRDKARALLADLDTRDEPVPIRRALTSDPATERQQPSISKKEYQAPTPKPSTYVRFQMLITPEQEKRITRLAFEKRQSKVEVVRQMIDACDDNIVQSATQPT